MNAMTVFEEVKDMPAFERKELAILLMASTLGTMAQHDVACAISTNANSQFRTQDFKKANPMVAK